jgi:hypothetical protein
MDYSGTMGSSPPEGLAAMSTLIILATTLVIIPVAAVKYGTDSRDLVRRDPRSLIA